LETKLRPEKELLESKDLREAILLSVIPTAVEGSPRSDALSYLARYSTGEAADRSAVGR
jgi:hypothetical protein